MPTILPTSMLLNTPVLETGIGNNRGTLKAYIAACLEYDVEPNRKIMGALSLAGTELVLTHKKLSDKDLRPLCAALKKDTVITTLILEHNTLTADAADLLAKLLRSNNTITELSLTGNDIGTEAACRLMEAIKDRTRTVLLHVSVLEDHPIAQKCSRDINDFRKNKGLAPHEITVIFH